MSNGYVLADFDLATLQAYLTGCERPSDLKIGMLLAPKEQMVVFPEPPVVIAPCTAGKLLLKLEYADQDLVASGFLSEMVVIKQAYLQGISFMNEREAELLGHLFEPDRSQARRGSLKGESLVANEFPRKRIVLRAMGSTIGHLLPMDHVYIASGSIVTKMTKNVVSAYESGDRTKLLNSTEKTLIRALDHAAAMAQSTALPQHVCVCIIENRHLYKSPIDESFFFDGLAPIKADPLISVDPTGVATMAKGTPGKRRLLSKSY